MSSYAPVSWCCYWQPLFSVILSRYISLSIHLCLSAEFSPLQTAPGNSLTPGVAYVTIAYGQTAGVRNVFPAHCAGVANMSPIIICPLLWRYITDIGYEMQQRQPKRLPTYHTYNKPVKTTWLNGCHMCLWYLVLVVFTVTGTWAS